MTTSTSGWDDLVTTALLGTERRPVPDSLPDPLARLGAGQRNPGLAVLDIAAGYANHRHAGAVPDRTPEPAIPPRQMLNLAPEPAQVLLLALLRSGDIELVSQWLRACTERRLGVRPGVWPALGAAAAGSAWLDRRLVCQAIGVRGVAFLARHPRWQVVARAAAEGPEDARAVLSDSWDETPGPRREALLEALAADLVSDDEPLLVRALADRRADVRSLAVRLLSRLPGSEWSRWTTARALGLVEVSRSMGRRRIVVQPPEHGPEDTAHGLGDTPPRGSTLGRSAHLLRQVLAGADLDAWSPHTRCDPDELLALLRSTARDWYADVVTGLADAAVRQRHGAWAQALLEAKLTDPRLVPLVPADRLEAFVSTWAGSRADLDAAAALVLSVPAPWSRSVSESALRMMAAGRLGAGPARRFAVDSAHRMALETHRELARLAAAEREARERDPLVARQPSRGFVEAEGILATRVEIGRRFTPTSTEPPETR